MSHLIRERVKGSELPQRWAEQLRARPDESFTVTIQSEEERRAAVEALQALMEQIGREAQGAGAYPRSRQRDPGQGHEVPPVTHPITHKSLCEVGCPLGQ